MGLELESTALAWELPRAKRAISKEVLEGSKAILGEELEC